MLKALRTDKVLISNDTLRIIVEIKPNENEQIVNLVREYNSSHLTIPALQRGKVWTTDNLVDLLESINSDFPIGNIFIWDDKSKRLNDAIDFGLEDEKSWILDGQQRISALASLIYPERRIQTPKIKTSNIFFNPLAANNGNYFVIKTAKEQKEHNLSENLICIEDFTDEKGNFYSKDYWQFKLGNTKKTNKNIVDITLRFIEKLKSKTVNKIVIVTTKEEEYKQVAKLFVAINKSGKLLTTNQIAMANVMGNMRDIETRLNAALENLSGKTNGFYGNSPFTTAQKEKHKQWILGLFSAFLFKGQAYHTTQNPVLIKANNLKNVRAEFTKTRDAIIMSVDKLKELGINNSSVLPHDSFIAVLSYLLYTFRDKPKSEQAHEAIRRFVYVGILSQHFAHSNAEACVKIIANSDSIEEAANNIIDNYILKNNSKVENILPLTPEKIRLTKRSHRLAKAISAVTLALHTYKDWRTNEDLNNKAGSTTNRVEEHHIFPLKHLKQIETSHINSKDSLANIAFVTGLTNNSVINDNLPKDYLNHVDNKYLEEQFIVTDPDFWDLIHFDDFVELRSEEWAKALNLKLNIE